MIVQVEHRHKTQGSSEMSILPDVDGDCGQLLEGQQLEGSPPSTKLPSSPAVTAAESVPEPLAERHACNQGMVVGGSGLGHAGDAGLPVPGPGLAGAAPASAGALHMADRHPASAGAADQVCVCSSERAMAIQ